MVGMPFLVLHDDLFFDEGLTLSPAKKGDKVFATIYLNHYPASKGIVGRQLNYYIKRGGKLLGIIGVNSPPLNYKIVSEYFSEKYIVSLMRQK